MHILKWLFLSGCFWVGVGGANPPPNAPSKVVSKPKPTFKILIHKAARKLEVLSGGEKIHEFKVVLGQEPQGTKLRRGDGKTPEGVYFVRIKNPRSQFYLSLGLSYPERHDAKRGLAEKLISKAQYDRILQAHDKKTQPPSNTPLGGEIFIHGGGVWDGQDWTLGCIALDNPDMKLLFDKIPHGTEVEIFP